jgi:hypothetical protein
MRKKMFSREIQQLPINLAAGFSQRQPGFNPRSGNVRFVVDRVVLEHVSPSTSVSPANCHSTDLPTFIAIYHMWLVQQAKHRPQYQVD